MAWKTIKRFVTEEDGMEMVEWALVAVLFAVVAGAAFTTISGSISTATGKVGDTLEGN